MPRNRIWALDLTGKGDLSGEQKIILGLIDHGTRACLHLQTLADKRSLTLLRELIQAVAQDCRRSSAWTTKPASTRC